ncbi:MAG: PAS domain-containing sensor histidine kinase [Magnetovibrionaceae bacterium]
MPDDRRPSSDTKIKPNRPSLADLTAAGSFADVFFSGVPDGIAFIDRAGFLVSCNPAFERFFGYDLGELVGQNISVLMPEPDRSRHTGYIRRYLDTGQQRVMGTGREVTGIRKDKTPILMNLSVGEAPGGFVGIVRYRAGASLAEGEDEMSRLGAVAHLASDPELDVDQALDLVLRQLRDLFGIRLAFLGHDDGETLTILRSFGAEEAERAGLDLSPGQTHKIAKTFARTLAERPDLDPLFLAESRDNRQVYQNVLPAWRSAFRQFGGCRFQVDGEVFLFCFGSALPRIEPLEDGEARLFRGLASAARSVLKRRSLERQKERIEAGDRAKTAFMTMINHEMRTPLNAIIGFSEIMAGEGGMVVGPEQMRDYAGHILDCGQHLKGIVNDILDLVRLQSGGVELVLQPVDLHATMGGVFNLMSAHAAQNRIALLPDARDDLPPVKADPIRLKQVLVNLCSNGLKFTGPGGQVVMSAEPLNDAVEVVVSDTGIGMSPEEIAHALEPFSQVDEKLARRYEGVGLGLPITRRIVELHGGTFDIASEKGKGTQVRITLPRANPSKAA